LELGLGGYTLDLKLDTIGSTSFDLLGLGLGNFGSGGGLATGEHISLPPYPY